MVWRLLAVSSARYCTSVGSATRRAGNDEAVALRTRSAAGFHNEPGIEEHSSTKPPPPPPLIEVVPPPACERDCACVSLLPLPASAPDIIRHSSAALIQRIIMQQLQAGRAQALRQRAFRPCQASSRASLCVRASATATKSVSGRMAELKAQKK